MASVDPQTLVFVTAGLTATFGTVVAALAYRGARRNDSDTMRLLAVGVVCIAVAPFVLNYAVKPLGSLSDAEALLAVLVVNIVGLVAILYSLEAS